MAERIFDDDTVRRLRALRLALGRRFAGETGSGARGSRGGGRFEFRDHRAYVAGDDFREIDWNLVGRLGQVFVKRFEGETEVDLHVVLDRSASMAVGAPPKDVFARRLAAALAFSLAGDGRTVRVHALAEVLEPVGEPMRSGADGARLVAALEALGSPAGRVDLRRLDALHGRHRGARVVVVLSDFLEGAPRAAPGGAIDLILGLVVAEEERRCELTAPVKLVGVEGEGTLRLDPTPEILTRYAEVFDEHVVELHRLAAGRGMTLVELRAEEGFEAALMTLARQGRLSC